MIDWFLNYFIVFSPKTRTAFKRPVISASPKTNSILKTILQVFISSVEQHSVSFLTLWIFHYEGVNYRNNLKKTKTYIMHYCIMEYVRMMFKVLIFWLFNVLYHIQSELVSLISYRNLSFCLWLAFKQMLMIESNRFVKMEYSCWPFFIVF